MSHVDVEPVFRLLDRAVWIVTAQHQQRRGGLLATWVMQTSIDPQRPGVMASISPEHFTAELIDGSLAFAAHLLQVDQMEVAWQFALGSGRDRDKLAALQHSTGESGSPLLTACRAWLDCRVTARQETGGRIYYWADVLAGNQTGSGPHLTEQQLLAAASPTQKTALRAGLQADIATQQVRLRS